MQSTEGGLAEAQKLNDVTDEKIAKQDKQIQQMRNEINEMNTNHDNNISCVALRLKT
jgi:TolA-binding protein